MSCEIMVMPNEREDCSKKTFWNDIPIDVLFCLKNERRDLTYYKLSSYLAIRFSDSAIHYYNSMQDKAMMIFHEELELLPHSTVVQIRNKKGGTK